MISCVSTTLSTQQHIYTPSRSPLTVLESYMRARGAYPATTPTSDSSQPHFPLTPLYTDINDSNSASDPSSEHNNQGHTHGRLESVDLAGSGSAYRNQRGSFNNTQGRGHSTSSSISFAGALGVGRLSSPINTIQTSGGNGFVTEDRIRERRDSGYQTNIATGKMMVSMS